MVLGIFELQVQIEILEKTQKKTQVEERKQEKGQYLCHIVGAAFVVGELEFAERHFLSHPVSSSVGRVGVHVHPVPCRYKSKS